MKIKYLTAISLCLLTTVSLFAQGRITFSNTSNSPLLISDGIVTKVLGTASTAYFGIGPASAEMRLYAGLWSDSMSPVLIGTAANQLSVSNTASLLAGAQGTFYNGVALPLDGFDGSAPVFLQFTAFAYNGVHTFGGYSPIIQVTLATGVTPSTTVFSSTPDASHWDGLTLFWVPEPSPRGLLGVGALAVLNSRKRSRQNPASKP